MTAMMVRFLNTLISLRHKMLGGRLLLGIPRGVCSPVLLILTLFQAKKCHFSHPYSDLPSTIHTHSQTWPLRNCHHYLGWTSNKKQFLKIHFEFVYFSFFLSHLVLKQEIRSHTPVVPLDTIPDSIPKWSKSISVFRPKRRKNHTLWGGTYLYGLYRGLRPPRPTNYLCNSGRFLLQGKEGQISIIGFTFVYNIFSKRKIKFWILYLQCIYLL